MALRSLVSLVRGASRARTCSSLPGIAFQGALGSTAVSEDALYCLRNHAYHHCRHVASAAISPLAGSRRLHSRAAAQAAEGVRARARSGYSLPVQTSMGSVMWKGSRRFNTLRDIVAEHYGASAGLAAVAVVLGILLMIDTDKSDKVETEDVQDPAMKTDAYRRFIQAYKEVEHARLSYYQSMVGKDAVIQEYREDDQAMKTRFEEWMKQYGRTYKDEEEKARRFKIFKSVARFADVTDVVAAELDSDICMGLNGFADRSEEELSGLICTQPLMRDEDYLGVIPINEASDKKATVQKLQS